ncbi:hypothetical protein T05_618 [Trichinella murrelli]|uniref:Uncharacterized protein n=1 Tax=Trichinella murrelli TaxID=144512 RepID=A0A0V0T9C8_9BILA|nr:hypothetical protein T05_618 [Trichinella murrelli]
MNLCLMFCESKDDGCGEQAVFLMTETSSLTATHVNSAFDSLNCWLKTDVSRPPPELCEQQPVINDCGQSRSSLRTSNSIGFYCRRPLLGVRTMSGTYSQNISDCHFNHARAYYYIGQIFLKYRCQAMPKMMTGHQQQCVVASCFRQQHVL